VMMMMMMMMIKMADNVWPTPVRGAAGQRGVWVTGAGRGG
jgi:hypothetical protein